MESNDKKFIKGTLGIALVSLCLIIVMMFHSYNLDKAPELIVVNGVVIFMAVFMATQRYRHITKK